MRWTTGKHTVGTLSIELAAVLIACCGALISSAAEPAQRSEAERFFETKIRPLLVARCYECHGPAAKPEGNLRLDSLSGLLKGGDLGPTVKPGDPKNSLLIDAVNHGGAVQMPPKTKLPAQEIADLTAWVAAGAVWPDAAPSVPPTSTQPSAAGESLPITADDRAFWAFQPPRESEPPAVSDTSWPRGPLDRFVLAALEAKRLKPAPAADKRTLIRRATFDLHGLPPTPEEVERFLADSSADAFAAQVDRLLASPRYGERWGRHWLDIARYADSNGMDENMCMADAWRYRDYVIAAFNRDLPYDQFVQEQLAGDLLPTAEHATRVERLVATGFLVLGPKMLAEDDPVKMEMDIIDEQVDTIGRAFLGLTLGCARCHDHKFDPIPTTDYYSLAGIFKSTKTMQNHSVVAMWSERPLGTRAEVANLRKHEAEITRVNRDTAALTSAANEKLLTAARARLADYLLTSLEREQQQRARAEIADDLKAGRFASGSVVVEAESFARGNVLRDFNLYGSQIGVVYNAGQLPNVAEYDFELSTAGTYQLAMRYAAAEARSVVLSIDGKKLPGDAAGRTTGSWQPDTQTWAIEAAIPLAAGKHTLRIERDGPFPHLDKWALVPARFAADPITGGWQVVGGSADEHDLNPAILEQWIAYLSRTKDDADSVLRAWHAWNQTGGPTDAKITAKIDTKLDRKPDDPSGAAALILRDPRPTTLAQLAARYAQLCQEADTAWRQQQATATDKNAPLADPVQESFRQLLTGAAGPFALPKTIERYYSAETTATLSGLKDEQSRLERTKPVVAQALAVDESKPQNLRVHLRGSHLTLGAEVPRQFPRVLAGESQPPLGVAASGRLELARWLTRPDHPLTSRVMVNRIWQGHFGEGLLRTPDNFGRLGERPDNQPLLDWLARQFVSSGWSIKAMHRLVMLSSAYQMSTAFDPNAAQADPENRLLWRMNRRRLEAEEIRDAMIAASGQLDPAMGGTLLANKNHTYVTSTASVNDVSYENDRRSVYLPVVRSAVYDVFQAFDFADPSTMNGKRPATTVAPQALFMMNSPVMLRQTRAMAEQLLRTSQDDAARVTTAYLRAYSRPANETEIDRALKFLQAYRGELARQQLDAPESQARAWQALCRVILSANEFVYLE